MVLLESAYVRVQYQARVTVYESNMIKHQLISNVTEHSTTEHGIEHFYSKEITIHVHVQLYVGLMLSKRAAS